MRLLAGFALVFVSIALVQGQLVVPQFNNLNAIISLIPQFQGFISQLDNILPQLNAVFSSTELQSLKDKVIQVVLSQFGNHVDFNTIADKLRPIIQQFLGSKPQSRVDLEALIQQITGAAVTSLPGMVLGLLSGNRQPTVARAGLNDILALADKFQLNTVIPQIEQFLGPDKLQQLQTQFFTTVVSGLGNNWNIPTLAQALQQLVTQFVPQIGQMRIDWEELAQSALNGVVTALPSILIGAISLFGKRDASEARAGLNDILALADKFQLNTVIPQIEQFLGPDKLQQLQTQFFTTVVSGLGNNWNIPTLAQALQQLVTQFVPQVGQMRIDWEELAQSALNGVVTALPSILIGAISLFGKRDASEARAGLNDILALADKFQLNTVIPQIEQFLGPDKLQQLQTQFFTTVVSGLGNNWNIPTLAQALQQLVTQFVPQVGQMRIDWEELAQSALNGVVTALPSILIGAISLFGKRDLKINYQELLAQLPVDKLAQIVQLVTSIDKTAVLAKLKTLLQSFFPAYQGRINFDELASNLLASLNNLLPTLSQSIFGSIVG